MALAAEGEGRAQAIVHGYSQGSLSMTCYGVGIEAMPVAQGATAAGLPQNMPPEQTNT